MPTRAELKQYAKQCMKEQTLNPILVTLVYTLIAIAISLLSAILGVTVLIPMILSIVSSVLQVNYTYYCMKVARREQGEYTDLAYGFRDIKYTLKLFALVFAIAIFTSLWSLLFIIPGVMKALEYSQAIMIMIENPEKEIMEVIRESQTMMNGHRMEYFILSLSFIPWNLLSSLTLGIASLWVMPYMSITFVHYYYALRHKSRTTQKVILEY